MAKNKLSVLADDGLSNIKYLCESWANVSCKPGRDITNVDLKQTDVLFTRSITTINESLIVNSPIKFIGSATIGIDHVDLPLLKKMQIGFANAPGCNANAVVDYVMSAVFKHLPISSIESIKVAIVGYGNVGKRLAACLSHFKIDCIIYDPFVDIPDALKADSFKDVLAADIISLHVPLTKEGLHPTFHLIASEELSQIKNDALLINTSRGAVIDNDALAKKLSNTPVFTVALDVWEGEPSINSLLLEKTSYATGHIAGYSIEGKARGSFDIVTAAKAFFNLEKNDQHTNELLTKFDQIQLKNDVSAFKTLNKFKRELLNVCDLEQETHNFVHALGSSVPQQNIAKNFDIYRKRYSLRHELDYRGLL